MLDIGHDEARDTALESVPVPAASVRIVESNDTHGVFAIEPLPRGYGMTLGNPLRRVLLSSIPGIAVNWVRLDGVEHEYSTISGVKEDVVDILLNIKGINLRSVSDRPGKLRLEVEGPGEVCAGDIMASSDFEIVNPEQHIATLDGSNARLIVEMNIEQGVGYEPASNANGLPIGVLPVDAIYTPVRKVNYNVERTRVGQFTNFERLVVEIWTNGAVTPVEAMKAAGKELVDHFFRFANVSADDGQGGDKPLPNIPPDIYNRPVESLNLTARTLNCLKRASIHKVGEILEKNRNELLRIRNFGEKSLEELDERLSAIGVFHPEFSSGAGGDVPEAEEDDDSILIPVGDSGEEEE